MIRFWASDSQYLGWESVLLIREPFYTSGDEICYLWVGFRHQKLSFRRCGNQFWVARLLHRCQFWIAILFIFHHILQNGPNFSQVFAMVFVCASLGRHDCIAATMTWRQVFAIVCACQLWVASLYRRYHDFCPFFLTFLSMVRIGSQ